MGRNSRNSAELPQKSIEETFGWPWKLTIDWKPPPRPKVCFLSGKEREYFPDDPGTSRHGIEYSMNCHPGDTPNPSYLPSEDRLQKPISLKGYGIGGLSAPRFAIEHSEDTPDPGSYQPEVSHPVEKKRKSKQHVQVCEKSPPASAFGTSNSIARFEKAAKWQNVGVGNYNIASQNLCKKLSISSGFGRATKILPPTIIQCNFESYDRCVECNFLLKTIDYYRSRRPISIPDWRFEIEENEGIKMRSPKYISICRKCYCEIMNSTDDHEFWTKRKLEREFEKTRHCVNIHEHNQLPIFIHKVPCNLTRNLTRKEAMMAKYFPDCCHPVVREVS